jgi:ABC-type sugar transport system ATPase subunit
MAQVVLDRVSKIYPGGEPAVADVSLTVGDREFVVLVGPSGCGKSTTLRMIAGLEEPSAGDVCIGGRSVLHLPPADRDIAMVFQSYALYPHMTVRENLAFALRMRKRSAAEIAQRVQQAAQVLGIEALLERKPKQLSGGERQRVAMGRALVRKPQAFLFDEPLSNLDARLRLQMRTEIKRLHQRLAATSIYVTHDQVEAMTLADRIVVMCNGRVQQIGAPSQVYDRPSNKFVAGFLGSPGMNFLAARVEAGTLHAGGFALGVPGAPEASEVIMGVRPEDLHLVPTGQATLRARVELREPMGADALLYLASEAGTLVVRAPAHEAATEGETVGLAVAPAKLHLFDPRTQDRIDPGAGRAVAVGRA